MVHIWVVTEKKWSFWWKLCWKLKVKCSTFIPLWALGLPRCSSNHWRARSGDQTTITTFPLFLQCSCHFPLAEWLHIVSPALPHCNHPASPCAFLGAVPHSLKNTILHKYPTSYRVIHFSSLWAICHIHTVDMETRCCFNFYQLSNVIHQCAVFNWFSHGKTFALLFSNVLKSIVCFWS